MVELTRTHVTFLMNQRKKGKTFPEIKEMMEKRYGFDKSLSFYERLFKKYKNEYDLDTVKTVVEVKSEVIKEKALKNLLKLIEKRKYIPIMTEFIKYSGMNHTTILKHFDTFDKFVEEARTRDPLVFKNIIDETSFTDEAFKALRKKVSENNRFFVTTAVTGCDVHEDGLKAIQTYCKKVKAQLLVLPCSDPARQRDHKNRWTLSPDLPIDSIVFKDLSLNDNIVLSTIKMSAKQLQPLTGIRRLSQKKSSTIVAAPKQFVEHISNSNNNTEIPRALMSSGAITKASYETNMYMSDRTAALAELDHTLGGIIVEVKNNKIFFARVVQINVKTGSFTDIDTKYNADGTTEKVTADLVQTGDWHVLSTDETTKKMAKELVELCRPKYLTFEDYFDGITINPHERNDLVALSKKAKIGLLSVGYELDECRKDLDEITKWPAGKIIMKYGNHEDFLKRYLKDGDFMKSPENKIIGMKLTIALEDQGINPFEYAMTEMYPIQRPEKVKFLTINDSFKVNGIENGAHGHMGKAGRRNPTMAELEDCYGSCNVGHNHSAAIFRSVFRVGTSTKLQLSYNDGASAWTQTHLIQHADGSRQLITNIKGEWRLTGK